MDRDERLELSQEEQQEKFTREVQQAKAYCLRLLVSVDRTESQLRTKMKQKGYSRQAADEVISYVKRMGRVLLYRVEERDAQQKADYPGSAAQGRCEGDY